MFFSAFSKFSKKSLIFLTFAYPLPNSQTFPDFTDWVENLPFAVNSKGQKPKPMEIPWVFHEHPWPWKPHFLIDSWNFHMPFP